MLIQVVTSVTSALSSLLITEKLSIIFRACLACWDFPTHTSTACRGTSIFETKSLCPRKPSELPYWGGFQMTQDKRRVSAWGGESYFSSWDGIKFPVSLFTFFLCLHWNIIALQCHVSSCCITKWISYLYTYTPSLMSPLLHASFFLKTYVSLF